MTWELLTKLEVPFMLSMLEFNGCFHCQHLFDLYFLDVFLVAVKPNPPAKHLWDGFEFDDDELKFQLPQSTSGWKRRFYFFLHDKLKLHDFLLVALFSLSLKAWIVIIIWFILAPVAHRWDLGPLYILATGFSLIFFNLGPRQAGNARYYTIFN
ncbi:uncharacterized protein [Euphorbia lathyris]|uniref:uncharacterized protein n=1 Tax=Euphorbia lathyris TaxID=212925 RepID=UPI0033144348